MLSGLFYYSREGLENNNFWAVSNGGVGVPSPRYVSLCPRVPKLSKRFVHFSQPESGVGD